MLKTVLQLNILKAAIFPPRFFDDWKEQYFFSLASLLEKIIKNLTNLKLYFWTLLTLFLYFSQL